MNGTTIASTNDNPQEQITGGFGYGLAFSIGVFLFIIIVTYCSYISTRSRARFPSRHQSYSITIVTTTEPTDNDGVSPKLPGIDENTLRQYPKLLYSDARHRHKGVIASECSICLADYKNRDMIRWLPECGHIFHLNCIDHWLRMHPTCPICRTTPGSTPLATPLTEVVSQHI